MTWFKADDKLHQHPKVLGIPRRERMAAIGLWTVAGTWCASQLTDGFVPAYMVDELAGTQKSAQLLVEAELWRAVEGGYLFHDWDQYQPTKAQVEAERSAARERMQRVRSGRSSADVRANNGGTSDDVRLTPSRPVPSLTTTSPPTAPRPDVEALCEQLLSLIKARDPKSRAKITATWRDDARRLIDLDGRPIEEIRALIDWCQADSFWQTNILSMPKFREKYEQLLARSKSTGNGKVHPIRPVGPGSTRVDNWNL